MATAYAGTLLKYNGLQLMVNDNIKVMKTQLYKRGFLYSQEVNTIFDLNTEKTVKNFQLAVGIVADGMVGPDTWKHLFASDEVYSDTNEKYKDEGAEDYAPTVYHVSENSKSIPIQDYSENLVDAPYFSNTSLDDLRKADLELKINFGTNSPMNETIKHLFLRSVSVEVDGSGAPIYKVYEFIAQDVI